MLKHVRLGAALATAAALSTGTVFAQDAVRANVSVNRVSTLLKTKVVIQDNQPAGEIVDIVYADGGCIDYYVASYDNQMYVIPFAAVQMRPADRVVFVDVTPTQFEQVTFFQGNNFPNVYAPRFRQQVFASFNLDVRTGSRNRNNDRLRDGQDRNGRDRDDAPDADRPNRGDNRPGAGTDRDMPARDRNDSLETPDRNRDADRPDAPRRPMTPRAEVEADAKAEADAKVKTPPKAGVNPSAEADADAKVETPRTPKTPAAPKAETPRPETPKTPQPRSGNSPIPTPRLFRSNSTTQRV